MYVHDFSNFISTKVNILISSSSSFSVKRKFIDQFFNLKRKNSKKKNERKYFNFFLIRIHPYNLTKNIFGKSISTHFLLFGIMIFIHDTGKMFFPFKNSASRFWMSCHSSSPPLTLSFSFPPISLALIPSSPWDSYQTQGLGSISDTHCPAKAPNCHQCSNF